MINNYLKEITEKLEIRFPIAELSRNLSLHKSNISIYYNDKQKVSENFIELFNNFYNTNYKELVNNLKNSSNNHNSNIVVLKKNGVEFSIEEVSLFFAQNQDDFLKQKIISNIIEMKVSKKLALLTSDPKLLKEYLKG